MTFSWYNSQGTLYILLDTVDYLRTCLSYLPLPLRDTLLNLERLLAHRFSISKTNSASWAQVDCPEHRFRRTGFESWLCHHGLKSFFFSPSLIFLICKMGIIIFPSLKCCQDKMMTLLCKELITIQILFVVTCLWDVVWTIIIAESISLPELENFALQLLNSLLISTNANAANTV